MKKRIYDRLIYTRELDISILRGIHKNSVDPSAIHIDSSMNKELFTRLVKVLKAGPQDVFSICIPGCFIFNARMLNVTKNSAQLEVSDLQEVHTEKRTGLYLAQAVPKKDFKECVFLAGQAGFTDIIPIISDFSFTKREKIKVDKLQKTADHACEIARDPVGCTVHEPVLFKEFFKTENFDYTTLLYLDPKGTRHLKDMNAAARPLFAVGPEGGFSKEEEKILYDLGALDINLGKRVLPSVSAGAFAAFSYQQINLS